MQTNASFEESATGDKQAVGQTGSEWATSDGGEHEAMNGEQRAVSGER
jgi:hypothetical protein